MSRHPVLPPTEQYSILEAFSPNSAENINQILDIILGNPELISQGVFDLTTPVSVVNYIAHDSFNVSEDTNNITIEPGKAVINNVLLETTVDVILNTTDSDAYLLDGDDVPLTDGTFNIRMVVYYNPTEENPNMYMGFVNDDTIYENNKQYLAVIGEFELANASSVYTTTLQAFDSSRQNPWLADGGWVGEIDGRYVY